jgi:hypothetical protein
MAKGLFQFPFSSSQLIELQSHLELHVFPDTEGVMAFMHGKYEVKLEFDEAIVLLNHLGFEHEPVVGRALSVWRKKLNLNP